MKLILAMLNDENAKCTTEGLHQANFQVTRIDSTGGFLRQGVSTLMIGSPAERVDEAIDLINVNCPHQVNPLHRRATVLVLDVEHFEQM